jgi:hypothetical protein
VLSSDVARARQQARTKSTPGRQPTPVPSAAARGTSVIIDKEYV